MPRVVDHAERRQQLADALWRVVRRDGFERVSVRTVAAEAGTSPGALRHYFATQAELAAFALQALFDRAIVRMEAALPGLTGIEAAAAVLEQYLPVDDDRRDEFSVYLALVTRPHLDGPLREVRETAEDRSRHGIAIAVGLLADAGGLHPDRDADTETARLYPLVDGLCLHGHLWPDRYPADHLRGVLLAHLRSLQTAPVDV